MSSNYVYSQNNPTIFSLSFGNQHIQLHSKLEIYYLIPTYLLITKLIIHSWLTTVVTCASSDAYYKLSLSFGLIKFHELTDTLNN